MDQKISDFKEGDVVRLKCGGPEMVVYSRNTRITMEGSIWCQWFDNSGTPTSHQFRISTLEKVEK